jgi:hypothetical protein
VSKGLKNSNLLHFIPSLIRFQPKNLLLTAAVGAAEFSAELSYDIPTVASLLDYINVMAYGK